MLTTIFRTHPRSLQIYFDYRVATIFVTVNPAGRKGQSLRAVTYGLSFIKELIIVSKAFVAASIVPYILINDQIPAASTESIILMDQRPLT